MGRECQLIKKREEDKLIRLIEKRDGCPQPREKEPFTGLGAQAA